MNKRIDAIKQKNRGFDKFCKMILNASYGSDGMNAEKYNKIKLLTKEKTIEAHTKQLWMNDRKLADILYAVQFNPKNCKCNKCLQAAYFTLDNANFILWKEILIQFIEQLVEDKSLKLMQINKNGDKSDEKKLLGLSIENEGDEMFALAPKNYYMHTFKQQKLTDIIKLKGVNLRQNNINKQDVIDNIVNGKIIQRTNIRLGQQANQLQQGQLSKNYLTVTCTFGDIDLAELKPMVSS
ncbi:MAG: hypothetical protein EZS28_024607 [Streblomastix strix]|uniref:Uncharacterized protein n=1 Tax=Streblomastix strix TaxID=222440 RepID=A0A5J4VBP8_9EUKA|nr:MAG: hypothetical protein EZS28_024607 [Streblomastix strix]